MWLRLFGIGLIVLGAFFVGPGSTHGPAFGRGLWAKRDPLDPHTLHVWAKRLIGVLLVIGGILYVIHPPARLQ